MSELSFLLFQIYSQHNVDSPNFGQVLYKMTQVQVNLDHEIPLLLLPPCWAKTIVGLLSIICFVNSYDGDFVFDDSEAIINNKVSALLFWILANYYSSDMSNYLF